MCLFPILIKGSDNAAMQGVMLIAVNHIVLE